MNIIRPHITLLVLAAIGAVCGLVILVYPSEGIYLGNVKLRFKTWESVNDSTGERKIEDVEKYLAQFDSTFIADSIASDSSKVTIKRKPTIASLQFPEDNPELMFSFFEALEGAPAGRRVHIYHYGDSQIETDRMTGMLREKLQATFGGNGPGLVLPLIAEKKSSHISRSYSDNWMRYTAFGAGGAQASHGRYGPLCAFVRFTPPPKNGGIDSTLQKEAWFEFGPSGMAEGHSKNFSRASLYYGNNLAAFDLTVVVDGVEISHQHVQKTSSMKILSWPLSSTPKRIRFNFTGSDSPDIYGIALQDSTGVVVSNIAMRGSDGNAFRKVNRAEMESVYSHLGADLIILQFGGNAVPYLSNENSAKNYGKGFRSQIQHIRSCAPHAAILVIGPSDMSTSVDGVYRTWPYLSSLRDGMKEAAFAEGCAFWDMYEVMGGENSMVSWVTNKPPYAGPDYTHFTPAGARKMAELMHKAIIDEYNNWKQAKISM